MKKRWKSLSTSLGLTLVLTLGAIVPKSFGSELKVGKPFPQHVKYAKGSIKPNHVTQEQMDKAVSHYYDMWKAKYLITVKNTQPVQKYIMYNDNDWTPKEHVTVSEAHGYGILTLAYMAGHDSKAKEDFDAMYYFYDSHRSTVHPDLMCWQMHDAGDGKIINTPDGPDGATDGDMDIAYALLLADKQWGSNGTINYKEAALKMIQALMESCVNQEDWNLLLGDWVIGGDNSEKFMASTRTSDFMLNHIRVFAEADTVNATKWDKVYQKIVEIINYQAQFGQGSKETGLFPDFMVKNAKGKFEPVKGRLLEGEGDGAYLYNACRTPWRLSMDYLLNGNTSVNASVQKFNNFVIKTANGDFEKIMGGYNLDGTVFPESTWSAGADFLSPMGVSATIDASNQEWLNKLWDNMAVTELSEWSTYFGNSINMLSLITISGNWWQPIDTPVVPATPVK